MSEYRPNPNIDQPTPDTLQLARESIQSAIDQLSNPDARLKEGTTYAEELTDSAIDTHLRELGVSIEDRATLLVGDEEARFQRGITEPKRLGERPGMVLSMTGGFSVLQNQFGEGRWRISIDGDTGQLLAASKESEDSVESLSDQEVVEITLRMRQAAMFSHE